MLSFAERLKDPLYNQLCFHVSGTIVVQDQKAARNGIVWSDSKVKSALHKALLILRGGAPVIPEKSASEASLAALITEILALRQKVLGTFANPQGDTIEGQIPDHVWAGALDAELWFVNQRQSPAPGSRCYLDYLQEWFESVPPEARSPEAPPRGP